VHDLVRKDGHCWAVRRAGKFDPERALGIRPVNRRKALESGRSRNDARHFVMPALCSGFRPDSSASRGDPCRSALPFLPWRKKLRWHTKFGEIEDWGRNIGSGRSGGGFRREVQPCRQHWFLNEKLAFQFRTPAFCSVSKGGRRLGEKEYRAPSVTPGVALRPGTQGGSGRR
jgi:hypothetical protein